MSITHQEHQSVNEQWRTGIVTTNVDPQVIWVGESKFVKVYITLELDLAFSRRHRTDLSELHENAVDIAGSVKFDYDCVVVDYDLIVDERTEWAGIKCTIYYKV